MKRYDTVQVTVPTEEDIARYSGTYVGPCGSVSGLLAEVEFTGWFGRFPASWVIVLVPALPPRDDILMGRQGFVYTQWEDEETGERYFVQATERSPRLTWADIQRDAPFKRLGVVE